MEILKNNFGSIENRQFNWNNQSIFSNSGLARAVTEFEETPVLPHEKDSPDVPDPFCQTKDAFNIDLAQQILLKKDRSQDDLRPQIKKQDLLP